MRPEQPELPLFRDPEADSGPPKSPGEFIKKALSDRGWSQADLAKIICRPLPTINEIINGKRAVMPEMAVALATAFGDSPELWAHREAAYRVSLVSTGDADARLRATFFELAPISEMERRGWIAATRTSEDLETELKSFFKTADLAEIHNYRAAARKTVRCDEFSPAQQAWVQQGRRMAESINARCFRPETFKADLSAIRELAASPASVAKVPAVLANLGVRLVISEPLQKTRMDGAMFWLDQSSPAIVMSLRYDRMDCFWFTLAHELAHIWNGDLNSIDADITGDNKGDFVDEIEERADREGADWLIPQAQLSSFAARHFPSYSKEKIALFAKRMGVHPGIVVGQLHHHKNLSWSMHRDTLARVRELVTTTAFTDGWGKKSQAYI